MELILDPVISSNDVIDSRVNFKICYFSLEFVIIKNEMNICTSYDSQRLLEAVFLAIYLINR